MNRRAPQHAIRASFVAAPARKGHRRGGSGCSGAGACRRGVDHAAGRQRAVCAVLQVQAYGEIKSAARTTTSSKTGAGGRVRRRRSARRCESGHLSGGGSTMAWDARATLLPGIAQAKTYASMTVANAIANGGYNAVASVGSRTQGLFSATGATPGRAIFHFSMTGSASSPYGLAGGRMDFLARPFAAGQGSFFDVFGGGALSAQAAGNHSFTYTGSFAGPAGPPLLRRRVHRHPGRRDGPGRRRLHGHRRLREHLRSDLDRSVRRRPERPDRRTGP